MRREIPLLGLLLSSCGIADTDGLGSANNDGPVCCSDFRCEGCNGYTTGFGGCGPEWCGPPFPEQCPAPPGTCLDCETLGEQACEAAPVEQGCVAARCTGADGDEVFAGCHAVDQTFDCRNWESCNQLDERSCSVTLECHQIYEDSPICDCAEPGCCMQFVVCNPGTSAVCHRQPVSCRRMEPVCGDGYEVSYEAECYEGCARTGDCRR